MSAGLATLLLCGDKRSQMPTAKSEPYFDGIRGLAALIVFLAHLGTFGAYLHPSIALARFGQAGLFIFFFLSAYLISRPIYLEAQPLRVGTWGKYLVRRMFRIVPLYTAVCLLDFFVTHVYFNGQGAGPDETGALVRHLVFREGRLVLWTMPVEIAFYFLLIPMMIAFALALRRPLISLAMLLLVSAWFLYVCFVGRDELAGTLGVHHYAPYFIVGCAASAAMAQFGPALKRVPASVWGVLGCAALILFMLQNPLWFQSLFPPAAGALDPMRPLEFDVVAYNADRYLWLVPVTMLIVMATDLGAAPLRWLFSTRPLVAAGKISFGVYLLHFVVLMLVQARLVGHPQLSFFVITIITFAAATALHFAVEKPGIRAGHRLAKWTVEPEPAIARATAP
jgi:peptidoglycan/LPS O-acetylase OafA/YrhL